MSGGHEIGSSAVIVERLDEPPIDLEVRTGWQIKPEGACRGDVCVPLPAPFDLREMARCLQMPLVHDEGSGLWALGPQGEGHSLTTTELPDIVLPDRNGEDFSLRSLRGTKVFMIAWASW